MKRSRKTALLLMGAVPLLFTACQQEEQVKVQEGLYTSVESCTQQTFDAASCRAAFDRAQAQATETAPRYANREECARDFPAEQCVQTQSAGGSYIMPLMAGFFLSRMLTGPGAGIGQQQASPAFRGRDNSWSRPGGGVGGAGATGRAGLAPIAATPDRAVTTQRSGFGASGRGRSGGYGG